MRPTELWRRRYAQYWREYLPYIAYAIRSGLGMALAIIFLVGSYFYARLLHSPPTSFPAVPIFLLLLVPCIAYSPVRTLLRDADQIFLWPNEAELQPYYRTGFSMAWIQQSVLAVGIWFVYWPLFRVTEHAEMVVFYKLAGSLLVFKLVTLAIAWKERQLRDAAWRRGFAILRWLLVGLLLYVILMYPLVRAIPLILFSIALWGVLLRVPASYRIHWNHLIELERATRGRMNRFLAWFVDVPHVSGRPRRRRWLDGVGKLVPYSASQTYTYLYVLIFVRSDGFGIAARLSVMGTILMILLEHETAKISVYMIVGWMTAVQLSALEQAYRHSDWMHVYPLSRQLRIHSLLRLTRIIHWIGMVPLIIAAYCTLSPMIATILTLIVLSGSFLYYGFFLRRKWTRLADLDEMASGFDDVESL